MTRYYIRLVLMLAVLSHASISMAAYSIKGKVIDEVTGKGIPNMAVTAKSSEKIDIIELKKYEALKSKTNAKGEYVLKGLSTKFTYNVTAESKDYLPGRNKSIYISQFSTRVEDKTTKVLDAAITMVKKTQIYGQVVGLFNSKEIADVAVIAEAKYGYAIDTKYRYLTAKSDKYGKFTFDALLPHVEYKVTFSKTGYFNNNIQYTFYGNNNELGKFKLIKLPNDYNPQVIESLEYGKQLHGLGNSIKVVTVWARAVGGSSGQGMFYVSKQDYANNIVDVAQSDYLIIRLKSNEKLTYYPLVFKDKLPTKIYVGDFYNAEFKIEEYLDETNIYLVGDLKSIDWNGVSKENYELKYQTFSNAENSEKLYIINISQFPVNTPVAIVKEDGQYSYVYIIKSIDPAHPSAAVLATPVAPVAK